LDRFAHRPFSEERGKGKRKRGGKAGLGGGKVKSLLPARKKKRGRKGKEKRGKKKNFSGFLFFERRRKEGVCFFSYLLRGGRGGKEVTSPARRPGQRPSWDERDSIPQKEEKGKKEKKRGNGFFF